MVGTSSTSGGKDYDVCHAEYGKTGVKVLYIYKAGLHQTPREVEVTTRLSLSARNEYKYGDNRDIIGTDSQKNIVYVLAKKHGITSPEEFGILLAQFFLDQYSHVVESSVTVIETTWDRLEMNGIKHKHAFVHNPSVERWASVKMNRKDAPIITAGLRGLRVLKTTQSEFKNFYRDEYRTLVDTDDRIFSTIVTAEWVYSSHIGVDFDQAWNKVLSCILEKFAGPPEEGVLSKSVQHTLYLACGLALESIPQIKRIQMDMPNKHYFDMDLSAFPKNMVGVGVNKNVFLPTDKPSGFIHAALERQGISKL
ncbi:uricase [Halyomorpha halys]|uniref:uricase n=1 Tax=Halyomorpha halys TaxID=286706 RepID=UPI0006D4EA41|nr:uricase [Halyomorpha halys]